MYKKKKREKNFVFHNLQRATVGFIFIFFFFHSFCGVSALYDPHGSERINIGNRRGHELGKSIGVRLSCVEIRLREIRTDRSENGREPSQRRRTTRDRHFRRAATVSRRTSVRRFHEKSTYMFSILIIYQKKKNLH